MSNITSSNKNKFQKYSLFGVGLARAVLLIPSLYRRKAWLENTEEYKKPWLLKINSLLGILNMGLMASFAYVEWIKKQDRSSKWISGVQIGVSLLLLLRIYILYREIIELEGRKKNSLFVSFILSPFISLGIGTGMFIYFAFTEEKAGIKYLSALDHTLKILELGPIDKKMFQTQPLYLGTHGLRAGIKIYKSALLVKDDDAFNQDGLANNLVLLDA